MKEPLLILELVPESSWGGNLRQMLPPKHWDIVRRAAYQKAEYRCEICGGKGPKHPVECHEVWEYDDDKHLQKLLRTIALCPDCHRVKHFGHTQMLGKAAQRRAVQHMRGVNGWTRAQVWDHVREAFLVWERRSGYQWTLDVTWLKENHDIAFP